MNIHAIWAQYRIGPEIKLQSTIYRGSFYSNKFLNNSEMRFSDANLFISNDFKLEPLAAKKVL